MKKLMVLAAMMVSMNAHANTVKVECAPKASNPWFKKLTFFIGREAQVSGSYVGYQNQDNRETDFSDKSQWMFPRITYNATDAGMILGLDFQGKMGSDEDAFILTIGQDGSAVLGGKMMTDCGDGNWQTIENQAYSCQISQ